MIWVSFLVFFIGTLSGVTAEYCDFVRNKDCAFLPDRVHVCGTDGQSYRNDCFLAKAFCQDNTIHKAHDGVCDVITTTENPAVHGSDVAFDIFCLDVIYLDCGDNGPKVCSNEGKNFTNMCEFDKVRCFHRELHVDDC